MGGWNWNVDCGTGIVHLYIFGIEREYTMFVCVYSRKWVWTIKSIGEPNDDDDDDADILGLSL